MPTPAQQRMIDAAVAATEADPRVESPLLSGSLGAGTGDQWSDVDLAAGLRAGENATSVSDRYARDFGAVVDSVHCVRPFPGLLSVVARDWSRIDLRFMVRAELAGQDAARLVRLFARPGAAVPRPLVASPSRARFDVEQAAREFLRIAGLGPGVLARGHYLVALDGMQLLRNLCSDLMLAETDHARADASPKRLELLLTDDQRATLRALHPLSAARASLIGTLAALSELFLPRARALAARRGASWPDEFEGATRAWLRESLGIELAWRSVG